MMLLIQNHCASPGASDRGRRRGAALVLFGLVGACGGADTPNGLTEADAPTTTASETAASETASASAMPPARPRPPPPPPFALPEGCGDGVIVAGQYDCFVPVSLDWLPEPWDKVSYMPFDLDEDGRDEILLRRSNGELAALRWSDGEFTLDTDIAPDDSLWGSGQMFDGWDWDGDGRRDLTILGGNGHVRSRSRLADGRLGPVVVRVESIEYQRDGPWAYRGYAVPIDIDGDGQLEIFASEIVSDPQTANPPEALSLYRRNGDTWEAFGPKVLLEPCGWLTGFAFGDFDEDGDEDLAIFDGATVCDGYPAQYDPNWYRVGVFLADSAAGTLAFGGWVPAGGTYGDNDRRLWSEDIDGDGHLDLVMHVTVPVTDNCVDCGLSQMSVLRGRGDGSFEDGKPVDLSPALPSSRSNTIGDLDGDGSREWIVSSFEGQGAVLPLDFALDHLAPLPHIYDPSRGGLSKTSWAAGRGSRLDVNGDGITDYVGAAEFAIGTDPGIATYLMVSAP